MRGEIVSLDVRGTTLETTLESMLTLHNYELKVLVETSFPPKIRTIFQTKYEYSYIIY